MGVESKKTESVELGDEFADIVRAVQAREPIKDAVGIDDATIDATLRQAYTFYENDRFERAAILAEGVRSLDVTRFYPHFLLGDIYMRRGEVTAAIDEFEEALEIRPESRHATLKLAEAKTRQGWDDEARELLQALLSFDDLDISLRDRARVLMEQLD